MTTYDRVLDISKHYLGPAAETFIARQCKAYLKKDAAELTAADLPTLAKWMELGAGLLMDATKAAELGKKITRG